MRRHRAGQGEVGEPSSCVSGRYGDAPLAVDLPPYGHRRGLSTRLVGRCMPALQGHHPGLRRRCRLPIVEDGGSQSCRDCGRRGCSNFFGCIGARETAGFLYSTIARNFVVFGGSGWHFSAQKVDQAPLPPCNEMWRSLGQVESRALQPLQLEQDTQQLAQAQASARQEFPLSESRLAKLFSGLQLLAFSQLART